MRIVTLCILVCLGLASAGSKFDLTKDMAKQLLEIVKDPKKVKEITDGGVLWAYQHEKKGTGTMVTGKTYGAVPYSSKTCTLENGKNPCKVTITDPYTDTKWEGKGMKLGDALKDAFKKLFTGVKSKLEKAATG